MLEPTYPLADIPANVWTKVIDGPVTEVLVTGTSDFYYCYAETAPLVNSLPGHHRAARKDLVTPLPEGMALWVRSRNRPIVLSITVDAV